MSRPLGPLGRFWAVTVSSAWAALGGFGLSRSRPLGPLGPLGPLNGFGLSRCRPLGGFWAVLGCHGLVHLVRLGSFGLSQRCPLGRFWVVLGCPGLVRLVRSTVLGCQGVVRLGGFGRFWAVTVSSAWSAWAVLGCHGMSQCCPLRRFLGGFAQFWAVTVFLAVTVLNPKSWTHEPASVEFARQANPRCHNPGRFLLLGFHSLMRFGADP